MKFELRNISKEYEGKNVLNNLSFELTEGVYGLLGANGTGKSTLIRIMCNLVIPSTGEVLFNGQNINNFADQYRSILGYLPQEFNYYPEFTGKKFMLYVAALKGLNSKTAKIKCQELLELVGLTGEENKKIESYSVGMKQRLGIAQALINNPKVLILDEPTVGLDPKERVKFRNLLSSLASTRIVLLSTHIVTDVEYIADEILILKDGRIQDYGSPSELVEKIKGHVYECKVPRQKVDEMMTRFTIGNQRTEENQTILRIISNTKPTSDAVHVEATLEDLYLYYFREGE